MRRYPRPCRSDWIAPRRSCGYVGKQWNIPIKRNAWMGSTHFLTRTLNRVSAEMRLHVLAYNLKRVMTILGVKPLIQAMQAQKPVFALQNRRTQYLSGVLMVATKNIRQ